MDIYYENSKKEKVYLNKAPFRMLAVNTLFDYEWKHTTKGLSRPQVVKFTKTMIEKQFDIVVSGADATEYKENIRTLLECFDTDISSITKGKLYIGSSYISCYIIKSNKAARYVNTRKSTISFTLIAENGNWIKEETYSFARITNEIFESDGLDYPYDYPYDYANILVNQKLVNNNYASSDFEMTIYGSCENPVISIGTHTYSVEASLITGEFIKINSATKKVYKVKNNGDAINLFDKKGKDFYIFEKIPKGILNVAWDGGFGFDIKLLSERSEPEWT